MKSLSILQITGRHRKSSTAIYDQIHRDKHTDQKAFARLKKYSQKILHKMHLCIVFFYLFFKGVIKGDSSQQILNSPWFTHSQTILGVYDFLEYDFFFNGPIKHIYP